MAKIFFEKKKEKKKIEIFVAHSMIVCSEYCLNRENVFILAIKAAALILDVVTETSNLKLTRILGKQ